MTAQLDVAPDTKQYRPRRCRWKECQTAFIPERSGQLYHTRECQKAAALENKPERDYGELILQLPEDTPAKVVMMAYTPCNGCAFLRDCCHKVKHGKAPYCSIENPMNYLFVKKYADGAPGKGSGGRKLLARQLAERLEAV